MDAVQTVLRNYELLSMICDAIQDVSEPQDDEADEVIRSRSPLSTQCRRELLAFALVCRKICEVALDALWKDISYELIYLFLFPHNIMSRDGDKIFDRPPITIRHWSRFDFYAHRVRTLNIPDIDITFDELLPRHPHQHHHFPYITSLKFDNSTVMLPLISTFLGPTIIQISLTTMGDEDDDTIADTMQTVAETCPLLRNFCYSHPFRCVLGSIALEDSIISIIHRCVHLQEVSIPASRMVVDALGRLPLLSSLNLTYSHFENRPLQQTGHPTKRDSWDQRPFVALDHLVIQGSFSSTFLTDLLRDAGCFPRTKLDININYPALGQDFVPFSSLELAEVIRLVMHQSLSCGLQKIAVTRWPTTSQMAQVVPEDLWQPFRFLLPLSHLQVVEMCGFNLDINDSDLEEMIQNWRELRSLTIDAVGLLSQPRSNVTFLGLAHLSTLPELRDLSVTLKSDCNILPSLISKPTSSISPLTTIDIRGKFPLVTTLQLTLFLVKYFPNLKDVNVYGRNLGRRPNEIETGLEFARQTLQAMYDSTAK